MLAFCLILIDLSGLSMYYLIFFISDSVVVLWFCLAVLLVAFSKSTQFGLHIWLPDAMEGPIPVSSLIHALTLVTIGIILTGIVWYFIDLWFSFFIYVAFWISIIIFCIAWLIMLQMDIKRIVAFSTIYQIASSMFVVFTIDFTLGYFLFCYHMFYKATLFMVLGVLIHTYFSIQDLRLITFNYSLFLLYSVLTITIFNSLS